MPPCIARRRWVESRSLRVLNHFHRLLRRSSGSLQDMSPHPDLPDRSSAARGLSRDAGLLRIRAVTKGAAVTAAFGSVALSLVLAHPAQTQAASSPGTTVAGQGTKPGQAQTAAPSNNQLAAPPQPPADAAPQAPPQVVSGGS
jgi:hypothetical protein